VHCAAKQGQQPTCNIVTLSHDRLPLLGWTKLYVDTQVQTHTYPSKQSASGSHLAKQKYAVSIGTPWMMAYSKMTLSKSQFTSCCQKTIDALMADSLQWAVSTAQTNQLLVSGEVPCLLATASKCRSQPHCAASPCAPHQGKEGYPT
jgi:hypothetical protein